ncbi:MAG: hypothetical protein KJZ70_12500 [Bryobacterales bacterium]|nr:hypothetical protein [Bryobacterales bacterium]
MTPYEELTERWPKVLQSALWRAGGFLALAGFPGAAALSAIRTEAADALRDSERQEWPEPKPSDWRGGQPQRFLGGVTAGPRMNEMFARRETVAMLRGLLGANLRCAGGGSLTVYERPGDRLGLHRDIETCDVTLVTCIWEEGERRESVLRAYPEYAHCALSLIPADRASLGCTVSLRPGDSAILLGGVVPHEVTPMAAGQRRVVSLVCYQLLDSDG